jgi:hypothetical protein
MEQGKKRGASGPPRLINRLIVIMIMIVVRQDGPGCVVGRHQSYDEPTGPWRSGFQ